MAKWESPFSLGSLFWELVAQLTRFSHTTLAKDHNLQSLLFIGMQTQLDQR